MPPTAFSHFATFHNISAAYLRPLPPHILNIICVWSLVILFVVLLFIIIIVVFVVDVVVGVIEVSWFVLRPLGGV